MDTNITVLISSSPIKSHPSTDIIDETIKSIRERLPNSIILIMQDGVRLEQHDYRANYEEYLTRLQKKYPDLEVICMSEHKHQARTTRECLDLVTTPLILFIEHDMPLQGRIPIEKISNMIINSEADLVRVLYEDNDLINFKHMLGERVGDFTQTKQWSQRPHFAGTDYYRKILNTYFTPESKTFIEDRMHGVIDSEDNWNAHKLWVYTPNPPVNRFKINDGRDGDPKWDDELVY